VTPPLPPPLPPDRLWAEIDAGALAHNVALLRRRFGPARLMAVVKANAYGHDLSLVAPLCAGLGLSDFGVATPAEGAALRALLPSSANVYLLGPAFPDEAPAIAFHRLTPLLSDPDTAQALSEAACALGMVADVHLDVDTGIGRAGMRPERARDLLAALDALPGLRASGVATHMASADEDPADARAQHALFADFLSGLGGRADTLLVHAANSPAALNLPPPARHGLIRPGLLLYGIEPTPGDFTAQKLALRPVLSLKTRVTLCRALPGGATISYGRTYAVPPGGGVYATLGVGYGDGYPRRFSNMGHVLLRGRRAPIRGRVCMDQIVVDVGDIPGVRAGDTATLIGADGDLSLTAGGLAAALRTTPHEITTGLTARVPRRVVHGP
jgi:alanine racemase